jgi:hypothetical protein
MVFKKKTLEAVSLFRKIGEHEGLKLHAYFEEVVGCRHRPTKPKSRMVCWPTPNFRSVYAHTLIC